MSDQMPPSDEQNSQQDPAQDPAATPESAPESAPEAPAAWPTPAPESAAAPVVGAQVPDSYAPQPAVAPAFQAVPTSSNAIIAFVLSIVSWAICPIVPAIVALVLAQSAQREIAAGQGRVQGGGLVTAAKIISWINIGLWAAILVVGAFIGILAVVASSA